MGTERGNSLAQVLVEERKRKYSNQELQTVSYFGSTKRNSEQSTASVMFDSGTWSLNVLGLWWTEGGSWGGTTMRREMQGGEGMGRRQWFSSGPLNKKKIKKIPQITAN